MGAQAGYWRRDRAFTRELLPLLTVDGPDGAPLFSPNLSAETAEAAATLVGRASTILSEADSIAADFQTAMQNLLVAELFGTRVAARVPLDPSIKVWTLEEAPALRDWLANETAWGRECTRIEAETRALLVQAREQGQPG